MTAANLIAQAKNAQARSRDSLLAEYRAAARGESKIDASRLDEVLDGLGLTLGEFEADANAYEKYIAIQRQIDTRFGLPDSGDISAAVKARDEYYKTSEAERQRLEAVVSDINWRRDVYRRNEQNALSDRASLAAKFPRVLS